MKGKVKFLKYSSIKVLLDTIEKVKEEELKNEKTTQDIILSLKNIITEFARDHPNIKNVFFLGEKSGVLRKILGDLLFSDLDYRYETLNDIYNWLDKEGFISREDFIRELTEDKKLIKGIFEKGHFKVIELLFPEIIRWGNIDKDVNLNKLGDYFLKNDNLKSFFRLLPYINYSLLTKDSLIKISNFYMKNKNIDELKMILPLIENGSVKLDSIYEEVIGDSNLLNICITKEMISKDKIMEKENFSTFLDVVCKKLDGSIWRKLYASGYLFLEGLIINEYKASSTETLDNILEALTINKYNLSNEDKMNICIFLGKFSKKGEYHYEVFMYSLKEISKYIDILNEPIYLHKLPVYFIDQYHCVSYPFDNVDERVTKYVIKASNKIKNLTLQILSQNEIFIPEIENYLSKQGDIYDVLTKVLYRSKNFVNLENLRPFFIKKMRESKKQNILGETPLMILLSDKDLLHKNPTIDWIISGIIEGEKKELASHLILKDYCGRNIFHYLANHKRYDDFLDFMKITSSIENQSIQKKIISILTERDYYNHHPKELLDIQYKELKKLDNSTEQDKNIIEKLEKIDSYYQELQIVTREKERGHYRFFFTPSILDTINIYLDDLLERYQLEYKSKKGDPLVNKNIYEIFKGEVGKGEILNEKLNIKSILKITDDVDDSKERSLKKHLENSYGTEGYKAINLLQRMGYSISKSNKSKEIVDKFQLLLTKVEYYIPDNSKSIMRTHFEKIGDIIFKNLCLSIGEKECVTINNSKFYINETKILYNIKSFAKNHDHTITQKYSYNLEGRKKFFKLLSEVTSHFYGEDLLDLYMKLYSRLLKYDYRGDRYAVWNILKDKLLSFDDSIETLKKVDIVTEAMKELSVESKQNSSFLYESYIEYIEDKK